MIYMMIMFAGSVQIASWVMRLVDRIEGEA